LSIPQYYSFNIKKTYKYVKIIEKNAVLPQNNEIIHLLCKLFSDLQQSEEAKAICVNYLFIQSAILLF
jgi:hypothetical protein